MLKYLLFPLLLYIFVAQGCAMRIASAEPSMHSSLSLKERQEARILIQEAYLRLEVSDLQELTIKSEAITTAAGGYIESSDKTEEQSVHQVLRVPADKLEPVLDSLAQLGKVKNRNISAHDVTGEVIDIEARLKNNMALRDRLRILLQQAKDVKDILAVEEQLTRLQSEIDSMEGRLKSLKSRAAMSKIALTGNRKTILGPLGYVFTGVWWGISKLFVIR